MKSKELKTYNLPEDRVVLSYIDAKPVMGIFLIFVLGGILLVYQQYFMGGAIVLMSLGAMFLLPSRKLIEFYSDYLVLYNHANKDVCEMIYYEDVVSWQYAYGVAFDKLNFKLVDNSIHSVDGFSIITFENQLNKYLKDKKEVKKEKKKRVKKQEV